MMLAVSDTHFKTREEAEKFLKSLKFEFEVLVHAGDFESYECYLAFKDFCERSGIEFLAAKGNCDKFEISEVSFKAGIAVKHEPLMSDCSDMYYLARELEAKVLVFGHIHRFAVVSKKPLVFCPGARGQFATFDGKKLIFFSGGEEVESLRV